MLAFETWLGLALLCAFTRWLLALRAQRYRWLVLFLVPLVIWASFSRLIAISLPDLLDRLAAVELLLAVVLCLESVFLYRCRTPWMLISPGPYLAILFAQLLVLQKGWLTLEFAAAVAVTGAVTVALMAAVVYGAAGAVSAVCGAGIYVDSAGARLARRR